MGRVPDSFFRPRSVAIVGASPGGLGNAAVRNLIDHGFGGTLYLVNPRYKAIGDVPCYPELDAVPGSPDLAYILVPRKHVRDVFLSARAKGIHHLVVTTGGFREADRAGRDLEHELRAIATAYGATVLGPNCEGFWNIPDQTIVSFGSAARIPIPKHRAPIAIVSQSGSLGAALARRLQECGFGCDYYFSTGNELQLDVLDILDWLLENTTVRTIGLFIESLTDGNRLISLACRAQATDRSIVALAAGKSEGGRRATQSHTGKMASAERVYRGVFTQAGVVQVDTFREFELALRVLAYQSRVVQKGPIVLAISGGSRALIADALQERRIPLPALAPATMSAMADLLPDFAHPVNPIDLTGQVLADPGMVVRAVNAAMADDNSDAVVLQFANRGVEDVYTHERQLQEAARRRPLILSLLASRLSPTEESRLSAGRLTIVNDPADTAYVLQVLRKPISAACVSRSEEDAVRAPLDVEHLTFDEVVDLLRTYEIHFPRMLPATDAMAEGERVCYPVVAKLTPVGVAHKSDVGGVRVDLSNFEQLRQAVEELEHLHRGAVIVQEQVAGVEALLTMRTDPDFGAVVALGVGGILAELLEEVAFRALPVDAAEVHRLIDATKLGLLLRGIRGRPAANRDGLVNVVLRLQDFFLGHCELQEIELNPVIVPYQLDRPAMPVDVVIQ